ncbi:hypothetical protein KR032_003846 [Drosophila birchii]|nr:hypothetical protein KR032_003846 [Drosophila birchii]
MPFQCRTCAGVIYNTRPKNLFSIENATMLLNLIQVTGAVVSLNEILVLPLIEGFSHLHLQINNDPTLPSCICACCLHDLKLAMVFRERCLQTQKDLLQRGKIPKKKVLKQEISDQEEEEEAELEDCELQEEEANGGIVVPPESPEPDDDFIDVLIGELEVGEEQVKEEEHDVDPNVTEEFEAIYETSTDHEEFPSLISEAEGEVEEDCYTDFSFPNSAGQLQTDCERDSYENEVELERDSFEDDSCPPSPVRTAASVKQRGRPRSSTLKSGSVETTPVKPKKKKQYVTWKNMTEEQIVARKRQQRMRDCVCEQCGRHFKDQSNFKLHMLRHTGIRNFACDECGRRFYTEHLLSLHQRIVHKGERPYACRFCTKTFHNSTTRVIHERIHTNARPYNCTHCDKTFSSASGRKRHELIHTGVRAYSCSICKQSFQRNTHLKAHLRSKLHAFRAESCNKDEHESDEK